MNKISILNTNPKKIYGAWTDGYTLDVHTIKSTPIGENEWGHMQFDTERSEIGESLFKLKNRSDKSVVERLCYTAAEFIRKVQWELDYIL